jgi:hypothetical protein
MYYLQLNNASLYEMSELPARTTTKLNGETLKALTCQLENTDLATIKAEFAVEFNVRTVSVLGNDKRTMTVYDGYSILRSIAIIPNDDDTFIVTLAMPSDLSELVPNLQARIAELEAEVINLTPTPVDPTTMELSTLKTYLIDKTKTDLEAYLAANPITSNVHGNTEKQYTCTKEKQSLLTQAIAVAQLHAAAGDISYQPSWNATGEECTYDWTLEELTTLAFQMDTFVHPLVSSQQKMESFINAAADTATLLATDFSFPPTGIFVINGEE